MSFLKTAIVAPDWKKACRKPMDMDRKKKEKKKSHSNAPDVSLHYHCLIFTL